MLINVNGRDNEYQSKSGFAIKIQILTWKYTRKQSNFFLLDPWSKYWPHVSNRTHTSRMRKRCSGGSSNDKCASEIGIIHHKSLTVQKNHRTKIGFQISNFHFSNNFIISQFLSRYEGDNNTDNCPRNVIYTEIQ